MLVLWVLNEPENRELMEVTLWKNVALQLMPVDVGFRLIAKRPGCRIDKCA